MRAALIIILALTLAGCGSAEATPGSSATTTEGTPGAEATPPAESTTTGEAAGPTSTSAPTGSPLPANSIEAKAAQALAQKLGLGVDQLQLTAKETREWRDSSLGCAAPGMMYAQVITPGFKLTFSDGTKTYEVHTDERGSRFLLCENKQPVGLEGAG